MNQATLDHEVADELVGPAAVTTKVALLGPLQKIEAGVAALTAELKGKVYDKTPAGDKLARQDRLRCVALRTSADEAYESRNAPILKVQRDARALRDAIKASVQAVESPIDDQIRALEEEKRAAKAEADRIEAARKAKHEAGIATIRSYVMQAAGKTAAQIESARNKALGIMIGDEWQEYRDRASEALAETLAALARMQDAAQAAEDEAARFKVERAEAARVAEENRRVAAEQAAERKRLADAAEALRKQEADAAAARAEQDRQAEAARLAREAEMTAREVAFAKQQEEFAEAMRKAAEPAPVESASTPEPAAEPPESPPAVETVAVDGDPPVFHLRSYGDVSTSELENYADHGTLAPIAVDEAKLKLGELNDLLAPISITADGLVQLGYPAIPGKGVAKMYRRSDLIGICVAICKHVEKAATK